MKQYFYEWQDGLQLRECQAIMALSHECSDIVEIYEMLREKDTKLYLVCEYMPDGTLNDFLTRTREEEENTVEENTIQSILRQILNALDHIHSHGYMHRDLKPENVLMKGTTAKVADFSLARGIAIHTEPKKMTSYVSTRWYRAPELILCLPIYTASVDMFAVGCIMAELYRMYPMFPGTGELEQLQLILRVMGPLHDAEWEEGVRLSKRFGLVDEESSSFNITSSRSSNRMSSPRDRLEKEIPSADPTAIAFLLNLLDPNPNRRSAAREALSHEYFGSAKLSMPISPPRPTAGSCRPTTLEPYFLLQEHGSSSHDYFEAWTPPNPSATEGAISDTTSRLPLVSISPSMRNIPTDGYGCGRRGNNALSCSNNEILFDDQRLRTPQNEVSIVRNFTIASAERSLIGRQPNKRRRMEGYKPADAFQVDY
jgi:protein kinase